jgi:SIR2-like domain
MSPVQSQSDISTDPLFATLRSALENGGVVPVVGAGVSIATAQLPSWPQLIKSGVAHSKLHRTCTAQEIEDVATLIDHGELLAAAEKVRKLLGAPGGEFPAWLLNQFKGAHAQMKSTELIDSIIDLPCPVIATTNYDRMLSQLHPSNPTALTWQNPIKMQAALRVGEPRIFHLHGVYDEPGSVVFGRANYTALVKDPAYRMVLSSLWLSKTLMFIGCSFDGLSDPDLSRMLEWASSTFKGSPYRHYALLLNGSFSAQAAQKFLHNWRIQIVPYGPTHDALAATLCAINPQRGRAIAIRASRAAEIMNGAREPGDSDKFARLLVGIAGEQSSTEIDFQAEARALFDRQSKGVDRMRGDLVSMQRLMAGIISPATLKQHLHEREWNPCGQPPEYKEVVVRAHAALSLMRQDLLTALKRRGVNIHGRVLDGYCSKVVHSLKTDPSATLLDPYAFENTRRVLSSLSSIFDADADTVFPRLRGGGLLKPMEDQLLLLGWDDRLELRSVQATYPVVAELPIQGTVNNEVHVESYRGEKALICSHNESAFVWDPRRSPTALASYSVSLAYGINSVTVRKESSPLQMIVATIGKPLIWLEDFKEVRQRTPLPSSFFNNLVTVEDRAFGQTDFQFDIYEILPDGGVELRFSRNDVLNAVISIPGVGDRLEEEIAASVACPGALDPISERNVIRDIFLQWPHISHRRLYDVDLIALQVRLDFFAESDSVVLLLRPVGTSLQPFGYCHIPHRILQVYQIVTDVNGTPHLIGTVAPEDEEPVDLIVRYRGVGTSQGILFTPNGSLLRHEVDIVRIAMFDENRGFACDDNGVPFEISFTSDTASRLQLELQSLPVLFDLVSLR